MIFLMLILIGNGTLINSKIYENERAKEKISKTLLNGNEHWANELYQEEIGRLKHHLQLAKLSYEEIDMLTEYFKSW